MGTGTIFGLQPKTNPRAASTTNFFLSAAQPQPKDRGEINAFVSSWALCRGALKGATSSPWVERQVESADEQFKGKSLEPNAHLPFPRRLSDIIVQRPHCCDHTARCQRSRY